MAGKTAILSIRIVGDASKAQKAFDDADKSSSKFAGGVEKAAKPAALALAGLGAAAFDAASAAAEDQQAAALLAQTLRNSTGATDAQIASTEAFISKTSAAAAVADDELRPALATLVRATGDTAIAQDALTAALDVSAATGKDVESVSAAIAKGYAGNTSALGRLVPGIDKAVLATGDMNLIMAELARTTGGSAAAAANTAAGRMESMKIQFGEAKEALGAALLPALSQLGDILLKVAGFIQRNTGLFLGIAGAVAVVAGAIVTLNIALKTYVAVQAAVKGATAAWAAIQWVLNAALWSSPITWIVLAVIAFIAAIVLLWQRCSGFREFILGMWAAIQEAAAATWAAISTAAQTVWTFLTDLWNSIRETAVGVWDAIVTAAQNVWTFLTDMWASIWAVVEPFWNLFSAVASLALDLIILAVRIWVAILIAIWEKIRDAAVAVWNAILSAVQWVIDRIRPIIEAVVQFITDRWNEILAAAQLVWDGILAAVQWVSDQITPIIEAITTALTGVWEDLRTAAEGVFDWLGEKLEFIGDLFEDVSGFVEDLTEWIGKVKIPDWLSGLPDMIGSLGASANLAISATPTLNRAAAAPQAAGPGPVTINVSVPEASDPAATARYLRRLIRRGEAAGVVFGAT